MSPSPLAPNALTFSQHDVGPDATRESRQAAIGGGDTLSALVAGAKAKVVGQCPMLPERVGLPTDDAYE